MMEGISLNDKNIRLWKSKFIKNDLNYNDCIIQKISNDICYKDVINDELAMRIISKIDNATGAGIDAMSGS